MYAVTGYVGKPPPPPPPRRMLIRVHAFEPHFKIPGYVNGYTSVMPHILVYDCWSTNTGCVGWAPPPLPRRVLIRVHVFEPHFKIPAYANTYVSLLVYNCRSINKYGVSEVSPTPPPPPLGSINFCTRLRTSIARFLDTLMHTCMSYAMYISLQRGSTHQGWVRHTPPPPHEGFDSCICIRTPFQDFCQWIHVSYATYIGLRLLVNKYGVRGRSMNKGWVRHAPPPPPPIPVGFGFGYMQSNPISRFLAMSMCIRVSYTTYIGLQLLVDK